MPPNLSPVLEHPVLAAHGAADALRALLHVPGAARPHVLPAVAKSDQSLPDAAFWNDVCAGAGLPEPKTVLYALEDAGSGAPQARDREAAFMRLFQEVPEDGLAVFSAPEQALLRLEPIRSMTGVLAADAFAALAAGMCAQPGVVARSRREGVVLLHMGRRYIRAVLLFRERLLSALELPTAGLFPEHGEGKAAVPAGKQGLAAFLPLLDDFRLGWLPQETARAYGGNVYSLPQLPAEAEGFRPAFLFGPLARLAAGHGVPAADETDETLACLGLLRGCGCETAG